MARPAPSVERTVKLLKFLASHPRERFSLSDIARNLEFNKATCHAMLTELVDEGMLIRHLADKTYMLGPALVNLGTAAALDANEALDIARVELVAIHEELGVSCVATSLVGREVVVMARRDVDRPLFGYLPVGNRSRAVPPYAKEFMAWARQEEIELWLDEVSPRLSAPERAAYYRDLDRIRLRGYHATTLEQAMSLRRILEQLRGLNGAEELLASIDTHVHEHHELIETSPGPDHDRPLASVMAIRAPIFGPSGRVLLALGLGQFPPGITVEDLRHYTERLLVGTRRVTEALHGSEPFPNWARPAESGGMLHSVPA